VFPLRGTGNNNIKSVSSIVVGKSVAIVPLYCSPLDYVEILTLRAV